MSTLTDALPRLSSVYTGHLNSLCDAMSQFPLDTGIKTSMEKGKLYIDRLNLDRAADEDAEIYKDISDFGREIDVLLDGPPGGGGHHPLRASAKFVELATVFKQSLQALTSIHQTYRSVDQSNVTKLISKLAIGTRDAFRKREYSVVSEDDACKLWRVKWNDTARQVWSFVGQHQQLADEDYISIEEASGLLKYRDDRSALHFLKEQREKLLAPETVEIEGIDGIGTSFASLWIEAPEGVKTRMESDLTLSNLQVVTESIKVMAIAAEQLGGLKGWEV